MTIEKIWINGCRLGLFLFPSMTKCVSWMGHPVIFVFDGKVEVKGGASLC
jgi:hypothetical protein